MRTTNLRLGIALCLGSLLGGAGPALAVGLGGASTGVGQTRREGQGYFDGKSYDLGFHFTGLLGYESNYKVTTESGVVEGSGLWALEAGGELEIRRGALRLRGELGAMLRMPFKDAGLLELGVELPTALWYRVRPWLSLSLGNHFSLERAKTPPIFLDAAELSPSQRAQLSTRTIRYFGWSELIRPALGLQLGETLHAELGPYFRVRGVSFIENPYGGEPDYHLFDLGADLALKLFLGERFSARLKYDFARRVFPGYLGRPPAHEPALTDSLTMLRHLIGVLLRARIVKGLSLQAGYVFRIVSDNGGYFAHLEHAPSGGFALDLFERWQLSASLGYRWRDYRQRTPCEAQETAPGSKIYVGADCQIQDPIPLSRLEESLSFDLRTSLSITEWLQATVSYEMEDATSDLEDLLAPNHRILAGASFSF
jgi:hypothetical protein